MEVVTAAAAAEVASVVATTLTAALGHQDSLLVEQQTRDRKVASSNPGRSGGRIFFSRANFLC